MATLGIWIVYGFVQNIFEMKNRFKRIQQKKTKESMSDVTQTNKKAIILIKKLNAVRSIQKKIITKC